MIARLRGRPAGRAAEGLVLDVNGVGYLVAATPAVMRRATAGAEVTVETYLHVREDALQLYGFADAEERELFVHLLTVSGDRAEGRARRRLRLACRRAAQGDRARRPRALPGDSRDRQEDRRADRAGAQGEARRRRGAVARGRLGRARPPRCPRRARRARLLRDRRGACARRDRSRAARRGARPARAPRGAAA